MQTQVLTVRQSLYPLSHSSDFLLHVMWGKMPLSCFDSHSPASASLVGEMTGLRLQAELHQSPRILSTLISHPAENHLAPGTSQIEATAWEEAEPQPSLG